VVLFDLLTILEPEFSYEKAKVHLARNNGTEEPIDVFIQGTFDEWQRWQNARNFELEFVVSLLQAASPIRWLFAGLFRSNGYKEENDPEHVYIYNLDRLPSTEELVGRLYLTSRYKQRNSYPLGQTLMSDLTVAELLPERLSIGQFPGYKCVNLTKALLDVVVRQNVESWRSALSSVKGIYLITDKSNGKLYVGKADGQTGIWGRWSTYSETIHGHNVALKQEFDIDISAERQKDLSFSVLEIADLHTMKQDIDKRERHWKEILSSRAHGYNVSPRTTAVFHC
jgi:hypothetical protein